MFNFDRKLFKFCLFSPTSKFVIFKFDRKLFKMCLYMLMFKIVHVWSVITNREFFYVQSCLSLTESFSRCVYICWYTNKCSCFVFIYRTRSCCCLSFLYTYQVAKFVMFNFVRKLFIFWLYLHKRRVRDVQLSRKVIHVVSIFTLSRWCWCPILSEKMFILCLYLHRRRDRDVQLSWKVIHLLSIFTQSQSCWCSLLWESCSSFLQVRSYKRM